MSLSLLKLVALCDKTAVEEINKACKLSCFDILYKIKFNFYRKRQGKDWIDYCGCWYVNEYFEYIIPSGLNLGLFESISESIKQGHCPHTTGETVNTATSSISLIHVAAAAGNKAVVKYLLKREKHLKFYTTESAKLPPLILAVLKDRSSVLKWLRVDFMQPIPFCDKDEKIRHPFPEGKYLNLSGMIIASRNNESGNVTIRTTIESHDNPFYGVLKLTLHRQRKL